MLRRALFTLMVLGLLGCSSLGTPAGTAPLATGPATADQTILSSGTVVDGHKLGSLIDCSKTCPGVLAFAQSAAVSTIRLVPNDIRTTRVYVPFVPDGMISSGGGYIVVYDLMDGSRLAIRVQCGVGPCQVVAAQPLDAPVPVDYSCNGSICEQCEGSVCSPWDGASPAP